MSSRAEITAKFARGYVGAEGGKGRFWIRWWRSPAGRVTTPGGG
ncbi:hypothetical protein [Mycobacterium shottsii]|nr:hypothetical protein [Mycobacterium shottsii]